MNASTPEGKYAIKEPAAPASQDPATFKITLLNGPFADAAPMGVPLWVSSAARVGAGIVKVNVMLLSTDAMAPRAVQIVASYPTTPDGGVGLGDGTHFADVAKPESLGTSLTTAVENGEGQLCQVYAMPATGNWLQVAKASDILFTTTPVVKGETSEKK